MKTAAEVMTRVVLTIDAMAKVSEASARMEKERIHSLIVERRNAQDAYGIITDTDVVSKVLAKGKNPASTCVHEAMSKPIITIPPNCPLHEIAQLMARNHVNHLPVFDGEQLVGMVSSSDIFNVR